MSPSNDLAYLIQHLADVIGKQSEQVLQSGLGIGVSQFKILMALEWNPRVSQRGIADSLGQTEASVSRQVKVLTDKGLLVSKRDTGNRRRSIIAPTTFGMKLTEAAASLLKRSLGPELSGLGDERLAQLTTDLQKLHRAVCRPGKPGACGHQLGL